MATEGDQGSSPWGEFTETWIQDCSSYFWHHMTTIGYSVSFNRRSYRIYDQAERYVCLYFVDIIVSSLIWSLKCLSIAFCSIYSLVAPISYVQRDLNTNTLARWLPRVGRCCINTVSIFQTYSAWRLTNNLLYSQLVLVSSCFFSLFPETQFFSVCSFPDADMFQNRRTSMGIFWSSFTEHVQFLRSVLSSILIFQLCPGWAIFACHWVNVFERLLVMRQ